MATLRLNSPVQLPGFNAEPGPRNPDPETWVGEQAQHLELVLVFDFRVISWQEFWSGMHPGARARIAKGYHEAAQAELLRACRLEPTLDRLAFRSASAYVRAFCRAPLLDADNICAKPLFDGLKRWQYHRGPPAPPKPGQKPRKYSAQRLERRRWIFEDDDRAHFRRITTECVPSERDWIEVRLTGEAYTKLPPQAPLPLIATTRRTP